MDYKPLVYIAGPYTHPDRITNTRRACRVGERIGAMGAAVFIPHLSMLWDTYSPAPSEIWLARDMDVLAHCHAMFRIKGDSSGADAEEAAVASVIPVFREFTFLEEWINTEWKVR